MPLKLERVVKERVEPIIDNAMHKFLGITISELRKDISDKIEKNPLLSFEINTSLPFKSAKKSFKKEFLTRLLRAHYGNISAVAKVMKQDRRSVHRDIIDLGIDVDKIRKEMIRPEYYKKEIVDDILRKSLDQYREFIKPNKLEKIYENVDSISEDIVKELPIVEMTWEEAEIEFEKEYLKKVLEENDFNVSKTARKIGLRYETLHRKVKALGLK